MRLKIAICDDNKEICEDLKEILGQIQKANDDNFKFEIYIFYSVEELTKSFYEDDRNFDVIFLDIEFPEEFNGIYLGNKIRNDFFKENIKIIYISSFERYGKDLFDIRPFNFFIKPLNWNKIEKTIIDIIKIITKQNNPFEYNVSGTKYTVDLYKILYFESEVRKVTIKTLDSTILDYPTFYEKLSNIEKQLSKSDFFRVHRSHLVNYHNVAEFQYDKIKLINGEVLDISQTYRKSVRRMRNKKIGEQ